MTALLRCPTCAAEFALEHAPPACPCGELLEVEHPAPGLTRDELDARRGGLWRFRELLDPALPESSIVSLGEGGTPLLESPAAATWAGLERVAFKHEGHNPTGSFKDRGMTVAVSRARHDGARRLACASTGNTAASLAAYAAAAGLPAIVLAPEHGTSQSKLVQALAHGAEVLLVRGDFDAAMAAALELARAGELQLVNSIDPFRLEGQKTIVFEMLAELGWQAPDWIAFPAGNLGNCAAFGKALRELLDWGWIARAPRLLAVQAAGAAPFAAAYERGFDALEPVAASTAASAIRIGAPVSYARAVRSMRETKGVVLALDDGELLEAKSVVDAAGIGCEPASAAGLAGVRRLVAEGRMAPGERVLCVLTGHLLKDPETTLAWQRGELVPEGAGERRRPRVIEAGVEALRRAVASAPAAR